MGSRQADMSTRHWSGENLLERTNERTARDELIAAIADTMTARGLSQIQAAKLCRTDQPTLSKVLRGRTQSVTLDKLVAWLLALGRSTEIRVARSNLRQKGQLTVVVDE